MANPWFRMYAEFANDAKVQMMGEADQRRLAMLFCIRCGNGDETLHDEELAFQLRVSLEEWTRTKRLFVAKGFIDEANNLLNWNKRQYLSDSSTVRVRKHREDKKRQGNVSVTPPDQITDTDTEADIPPESVLPDPHAPAHDEPRQALAPTALGAVGKALTEVLGPINLHHPRLINLVALGVPVEEFVATAFEGQRVGKASLPWVLATIEGRRRDAAHAPAMPRAGPAKQSAMLQAVENLKPRGKTDANQSTDVVHRSDAGGPEPARGAEPSRNTGV